MIHYSVRITNWVSGLQNGTAACCATNVQITGYPGQVTCPECLEILKAWDLRK